MFSVNRALLHFQIGNRVLAVKVPGLDRVIEDLIELSSHLDHGAVNEAARKQSVAPLL
ncbi:MAG: hypothetical protein AAGA95_05985 [Pseudomonadota bacterium]